MTEATAKGTDPTPLSLGEALTVWRSAEVKRLLLLALGEGARVELDLGGIEEADLTGLQLLCAAHRWAGERGAELVAGEPAPALREAARRAGYTRRQGCLKGCLWTGGSA